MPLVSRCLSVLLAALLILPPGDAFAFGHKKEKKLRTGADKSPLSQDQRAIYFVIPLLNVDQSWANPDSLLKLLAANSSICPACFGIVQTRLFLMMGIPNNNISPDLLKQALSYVFDTVHKTSQLWGPWMQQGGPQNEGGQGGGGSPSNPFGQ